MEKIIIDGWLYSCKDGTSKTISDLLKKGEKATDWEHEKGLAYNEFNSALNRIKDTKKAIFIDNIFNTF